MSILCSMVGASFVTAVAEVIRRKASVTAFGNAQVDTAQSKFGGAAALFDGTGDYIIAKGNDFAFSTGSDFTIEAWVRFSTVTNTRVLWSLYDGATFRASFYLSSGQLTFYSAGTGAVSLGDFPSTSVWYHFAITRASGTTKFWYNGVETGSTASSWTATFTDLVLAAENPPTASNAMQGSIDEIRISKNARYTAGFTPSTTAFTNDANTLLLIHADGTDAVTYFEDDNGVRAPKAIIANVNAQISTAQSKFGGTSLLFDGTTDTRIIVIDSISETGAYTIEFWFRKTANAGDLFYVQTETAGRGVMYINASGDLLYDTYSTGTPDFNTSGTQLALALSNSVWYHVAYVREASNTVKVYLDGVLKQTGTSSVNLPTGGIWFGSRGYTGNMDEIRISNSARYTAAFTPASAPFVNDANTTLLIHGDGTNGSKVIHDDVGVGRSAKGITAGGNAQVDTAQSKFGGAAALFDGTGDYLSLDINSDLNFGTNNWTIEFYYRITGAADQTIFANGSASFDSNAWVIAVGAGGTKLGLFSGAVASPYDVANEALPSQNVWYHLAFVRNGNTISYYRDGVFKSSSTFSGSINWNHNNKTYIGYSAWNGVDASGWIDEFRISNIARYTTAFTPSTTLFQNDANTLLLLHMDGTDASTVFVDDNGTRPT